MPDRILVVEDEPQMLDIVEYILSGAGFECVTVADAERAWSRCRAEYFDLVVCDIMLPGASGLTLCRRIRAQAPTPVCFLSAKGSAEERVAGFEAGADDYIVKPFNARELVMRVQAILRRSRSGPEPAVENGALRLLPGANTVILGQRRVLVSDAEMRLLEELARHVGECVAWRDLVAAAWLTEAPETGKEMLKTTIHRLRGKLGDWTPGVIVAIRGRGYLMPRL
ncbi:MAG: response regulator transcription factor [Propionibacteriaceae bacterium]|jgi:DNA-binding response OmpR family regulator|nr:response regulator transcription factor [Propionibacteriaceae bacterium]